jgi:hypothetical protein
MPPRLCTPRKEHGLLLPVAFYRARDGVAHQVCVNPSRPGGHARPFARTQVVKRARATDERSVLRRGHTPGGPTGGPRRRFRPFQPMQQARKRHNHAVPQHGPARTRTWDQSIMRKLWLGVAVGRNAAWVLGIRDPSPHMGHCLDCRGLRAIPGGLGACAHWVRLLSGCDDTAEGSAHTGGSVGVRA